MRNWTRCSGVYSDMQGVALFLVCSLAASAQESPRQDPLDSAIQAVWQARNSSRFEEAAAAREQARALLQHAPVDSPLFAGRVQQVTQFYQISNLNAQARAVLQESLNRMGTLEDSAPSRIAILSAIGESWRQDGNLLKAVVYLEKAAAAQASEHPVPAVQPATQGVIILAPRFRGDWGDFGSSISAYTRLAELYRQLGRPEAVAGLAAKIRALATNTPTVLARFYEQNGQLDEAAAIYTRVAGQSADPQDRTNAWQSLANLDARQERYTDAIAATRQALAAVQSEDNPGMRSQSLYQDLAGYLRQAGLHDQAGQVYLQLLQQNRDGPQEAEMLGMYARFLADTERGAQGASLLTDYLSGSNSDPNQKATVLFCLADLARRTGDSQNADAYLHAGQALMPQPGAPPLGEFRIAEDLERAHTAVSEQRWDDAYALAMATLDAALHAVDGQQVQWHVPQIAQALAANKESAKAEGLFQHLFALAQDWSVDSMQPLIGATQSYAGFLIGQPDRLSEVPAAIERYRRVLIDANGPDSGSLAEPLRMIIDFERSHLQWEKADASARELLELQESLSGNTSEPYLRDLQSAAQVYDAAGDADRALPLRRKAITVAELLATPNTEWRRAETRMDAALALARLGQFEEAEALGVEAVALQRPMRTPRPPLEQQLEQIRWMKQAAADAHVSRDDK
jgi:tetratricopeptide (TPR) repeat protein